MSSIYAYIYIYIYRFTWAVRYHRINQLTAMTPVDLFVLFVTTPRSETYLYHCILVPSWLRDIHIQLIYIPKLVVVPWIIKIVWEKSNNAKSSHIRFFCNRDSIERVQCMINNFIIEPFQTMFQFARLIYVISVVFSSAIIRIILLWLTWINVNPSM